MERRTSAYLAQSVYALYGVAPNIRLRSLGKPEVAGLNPAVPTTHSLKTISIYSCHQISWQQFRNLYQIQSLLLNVIVPA